jgi:hypothetical protein
MTEPIGIAGKRAWQLAHEKMIARRPLPAREGAMPSARDRGTSATASADASSSAATSSASSFPETATVNESGSSHGGRVHPSPTPEEVAERVYQLLREEAQLERERLALWRWSSGHCL